MEDRVLDNVVFIEANLLEVNAKKLKLSKNSNGYSSKWEYKILGFNEKKFTVLATVNNQLKGMFSIKSRFEADFKLLNPLSKEEVENSIEDILYYCGAQNTMISSFLTNCMFGFSVPISPNVDEDDVSVMD